MTSAPAGQRPREPWMQGGLCRDAPSGGGTVSVRMAPGYAVCSTAVTVFLTRLSHRRVHPCVRGGVRKPAPWCPREHHGGSSVPPSLVGRSSSTNTTSGSARDALSPASQLPTSTHRKSLD